MPVIKPDDPPALVQVKRRLPQIDGTVAYTERGGDPHIVLETHVSVDVIDRIREETPLTPTEITPDAPEGYHLLLSVEWDDPFDCTDCERVATGYRDGTGWLCDRCDEIQRVAEKYDIDQNGSDRDIPEPLPSTFTDEDGNVIFERTNVALDEENAKDEQRDDT